MKVNPTFLSFLTSYTYKRTMLNITERYLIEQCLKGDRASQKLLYERFSGKMLVICSRYVKRREEAEDMLQEGFINVFEKLSQFRSEGSLEGWIRRIMVNKAIEHYRKSSQMFTVVNIENTSDDYLSSEDIISNISSKELLGLIQTLPPAYRTVFNLFAFEGMKHKEIAERLGITEGTSKSNLSDARTILKGKVKIMMRNLEMQEYAR